MTQARRVLTFALASAFIPGLLRAQTTTRVSVDSHGQQGVMISSLPAMSADGRFVAFASWSDNLVPDDHNGSPDVFVHDLRTGATWRASVDSNGNEGDENSGEYGLAISADGRYVAFESDSTNLGPAGPNGGEIFVHDNRTGRTVCVSVASDGAVPNGVSYQPSISSDGRYVAFASYATNLVPGDTNGVDDVFVHDLATGRTSRVSVGSHGEQGYQLSQHPSISADGRFVAFSSTSPAFVPGDTNGIEDVLMHDRETATTIRVSVNSAGEQANGASGDYGLAISADGRCILFASNATNLEPGGSPFDHQVYVHDLVTARTTRVSVDPEGNPGNSTSAAVSISRDGRFVAFSSWSSNLVPGDTNIANDVFVRDRWMETTSRVSLSSNSAQCHGNSSSGSISNDGRYVAFLSWAIDVVPGDTNGKPDVFVRDRGLQFGF